MILRERHEDEWQVIFDAEFARVFPPLLAEEQEGPPTFE